MIKILKKLFPQKPHQITLEERFTDVYENRLWESKESASGIGSDSDSNQVKHSIKILSALKNKYDIKSIADIPCGDFNWIYKFLDNNKDIEYYGYDIVKSLVDKNNENHPNYNFKHLDITKQVPEQVDLIFSKDMVNHLNNSDVWLTLKNMVASGAKYILITNNRGHENIELDHTATNASRHLDLMNAPFNLPQPLYADHYMMVWDRDSLSQRLVEAGHGPR